MKFYQYNDPETGEPLVHLDLTAEELMSVHIALSKDIQSHVEWLASDSERKFMADKLSIFVEKCELNGAFSAAVDCVWGEYAEWRAGQYDDGVVCDACIQEMIDETKEGK